MVIIKPELVSVIISIRETNFGTLSEILCALKIFAKLNLVAPPKLKVLF